MKKLVSLMVVSLAFTASVNVVFAQSKEEIVALVKQTKSDIEKNAVATLGKIIKGELPYKDSKNPSLYVFVLDSELNVAAHPIKPQNVGKNLKGKSDIKGKMFRDEMQKKALEDGEGWVDYYYLNPKTREEAHKESYFELANGSDGKKYIVGCGRYFDK